MLPVMADPSDAIHLPDATPEARAEAVRTVIARYRDELRKGATESQKAQADDMRALQRFLSLLEIAYLSASADGLADGEREALAEVIENATGKLINAQTLLAHFSDLDEATETLGRRERLGRVAANFDDATSQESAVGFAALVAIADGKLDGAELDVLRQLGEHFSLDDAAVTAIVQRVAKELEEALP
jgi:tellurite resistance protein